MLELSIVLIVVGVLLVAVMNFRSTSQDRSAENADDFQDQIVLSIYDFAGRNYRLPCADTDGDGYEGAGSPGICLAADSSYLVGGVPFKTLGLLTPTEFGQGFEKKFLYGVYRNTANDSDLARLAERTSDVAGDSGYLQLDDFRKALRNAGATLSGVTEESRIHVTGDGAGAGAPDCSTNRVQNIAFFVVNGGGQDADGNGTPFDGVNAPLTWPSGGSTCIASPNAPVTALFDDKARAIGFAELLVMFPARLNF